MSARKSNLPPWSTSEPGWHSPLKNGSWTLPSITIWPCLSLLYIYSLYLFYFFFFSPWEDSSRGGWAERRPRHCGRPTTTTTTTTGCGEGSTPGSGRDVLLIQLREGSAEDRWRAAVYSDLPPPAPVCPDDGMNSDMGPFVNAPINVYWLRVNTIQYSQRRGKWPSSDILNSWTY